MTSLAATIYIIAVVIMALAALFIGVDRMSNNR